MNAYAYARATVSRNFKVTIIIIYIYEGLKLIQNALMSCDRKYYVHWFTPAQPKMVALDRYYIYYII